MSTVHCLTPAAETNSVISSLAQRSVHFTQGFYFLIVVKNDSLAPSLPTELLFIHQGWDSNIFSFPQQPNQIHFQHPLSRHIQSFDNYYSRCRGKCYLNKEVHSNIISKNKTWKLPKYSIIEEQFRRKWLAYVTWAEKEKRFADIKNNMQKHKIFLAMLKHRTQNSIYNGYSHKKHKSPLGIWKIFIGLGVIVSFSWTLSF